MVYHIYGMPVRSTAAALVSSPKPFDTSKQHTDRFNRAVVILYNRRFKRLRYALEKR